MKRKTLMGMVSLACMLPVLLHADTDQELKRAAHQPATVVSVTKVDTIVNYAYNINIRVDCTVYLARYKSANNYVPVEMAPNHPVSVLVDKHAHWMQVFLSKHPLELRLMSATKSDEKSCANDLRRSRRLRSEMSDSNNA